MVIMTAMTAMTAKSEFVPQSGAKVCQTYPFQRVFGCSITFRLSDFGIAKIC